MNAVVQDALDPLVGDLAIRSSVLEFELFEPPIVRGTQEDLDRSGHKQRANDRLAHPSSLDPDGNQRYASAQGHERRSGADRHPILVRTVDASFGEHSHKATLFGHLDSAFGRRGVDTPPVGRDALKGSKQLTDQRDFEVLPGDHPVDPIASG